MPTYRHTPEMGQISGFGDDYERCCQDMLEAGCKWLEQKGLGVDLKLSGFEGVYGIVVPETEDAKELETVILKASRNEATGAMMHAVMSRLLYISKNGWGAYCAELALRRAEKES